jgi:cyclohexanecarboxyl-CoA dehydrogenase
MLDFSFTEEQETFRKAVRDFARKEIAPRVKEQIEAKQFPREMVKAMAKMGLTGMAIPKEYGGTPRDWVTMGLAMEELAKVSQPAASIPFFSESGALMIQLGPPELQKEWLPLIASGEKVICMGVTEPEAGSDVAGIKTRAVRDGDHYVINGIKTSAAYGTQGDAAFVLANTGAEGDTKGFCALLVPFDLPGVTRERIWDMAWEPLGRGRIKMENVRVPVGYRLAKEGEGFLRTMHMMDGARAHASLMAMGLAQAALDDALKFAKERIAFGGPIARFEAVSFRLAEAATAIELGRWLCYRTLWLRDHNLPHSKESAMCKYWCPKTAVEIIHDALLIHGNVGFSKDYPVEQRFRDAVGLEIGDGTANIMKLIIARQILGREFVPTR